MAGTNLVVGLDYAEQLDPTTRNELEQLTAAIQTWSSGPLATLQAKPVSLVTSVVGTQHNFDLTAANGADVLLRVGSASPVTFTGFNGGGVDGQKITVVGVPGIGASAVTIGFSHQDVGSQQLNRLWNQATVGLTQLIPNVADLSQRGTAVFQYDLSSRFWRLISFDQGNWGHAPFNGGDFTTTPGTWTVDAGDVASLAYYLRGRSLTVAIALVTTTVTGAANVDLLVGNGQWGGFQVATGARIYGNLSYRNGAGVFGTNFMFVNPAFSTTQIALETLGAVAWAATVNNTDVFGQITFEVN